MKILDKGKRIGIFAVLAFLAAAGLAADKLVSSVLYNADAMVESIFYKILPAVPLAVCSFSAAVLLSCRNTRASRSKNRLLNIVYGLLALIFAFAAAYYPFFGAKGSSLIAVAVVAVIIAFASFFMSVSFFKETYQKEIMTEAAKRIIISTVIIGAVCALALLIPQKMSYDAMQMNIARTGKIEGSFNSTVPFISFATASAPVLTFFTVLKDVVPKLRFSGKLLFILPCVWLVVIIFGTVVSGRLFLSNAAFGAILGYAVVFLVSELLNKKKN